MTPTSPLPAYFRQGSIVIGQWPFDAENNPMELVKVHKNNPYMIFVTLDDNDYSSGSVFIDDGVRFVRFLYFKLEFPTNVFISAQILDTNF